MPWVIRGERGPELLPCLIVKGWWVGGRCHHAICKPHQRPNYKGKPANGVR